MGNDCEWALFGDEILKERERRQRERTPLPQFITESNGFQGRISMRQWTSSSSLAEGDRELGTGAAINDYLQRRAKVAYGAAISTLKECCNERKLGSRAKRALKDLACFRLGHPAVGVLLLQLLVQVLQDGKSPGKDERKIVRLVHFLLGRVVEDRKSFAIEAIAAVERGIGANCEVRLRVAGIRTLGALSRGSPGPGADTQGRVLATLCDILVQVQTAAAGKEEHKGKKKRFSLRGWRSKDGGADAIALSIALVRSIRATGRAASAPVSVLLACRLQDVVTVRHALAIMLDLSPLNPEAVIDTLLEILTSELHSSLASDTLASMYLTRLCAAISSRRVVAGSGEGVRGGVQVQSLAERRRSQIMQDGSDVLFLHAFRTAPKAHTLLAGAHKRLLRLLQGEPSHPSSAASSSPARGSIPLQHAACRTLERVLRDRALGQSAGPAHESSHHTPTEAERELADGLKILFRSSPCVSVRIQAFCALLWLEEAEDRLISWFRLVFAGASFGGHPRVAGGKQELSFPRSAAARVVAVLLERCRGGHVHLAPTLLKV
jgi:hypothetical protein